METLLLLDNAKILELHNSKILVSLKVSSHVTPESYYLLFLLFIYLFIYLFISESLFKKCTTIHLTRKLPFWVVNRCWLAHFEYKEIFGQSFQKFQNDLFDLKISISVFKRSSYQMWALKLLLIYILIL